jgi:Leucine-rich repeat (LRR) protein/GTPase SAR1 family protein
MTSAEDTPRIFPIGSAEGRAEAERRIAEAQSTGATELDLGGLGLEEIPVGLLALSQLQVLYLGLRKKTAKELYYLCTVERACNAMRALPPTLFTSLLHLQLLHLELNQLTSLPPEIGRLAKLQRLVLQGNQLTSLPAEIGRLAALERLDLKGNQLTLLPAEIGRLARLQRLDLEGNQLTSLPVEFGQLAGLQWLDLEGNRLTALPAEIGQLAGLKVLVLKGNQLTSLPAEFGRLAALERLHLQCAQLTSLPAGIGRLAALKELYLIENQLTSLPAEIGKLAGLKELNLKGNQLAELPAEIGKLAALEALYLEGNQLAELRPEIGKLAALKALYLQGNQLASLPPEIGQLAALEWLNLEGNQLTTLPPEIGQLAALEWLNLEGNRLTMLPPEIGRLAALRMLDFRGNRLPPAFQKAWKEGGIASLAALLQAQREKTTLLFEAKLLVTGEGKVGKSWALAALRSEDPHTTVGDQTTYGVYCGELRLPHPNAGPNGKVPASAVIHLNTWDFGGQNVYRITHQFFFTQEAIYLLVWNPRSGAEQCRVREWLRMIGLRTGGNAKVIVVASHSPKDKTPYLPKYDRDNLPSNLRAMIVDEIAIDSEKGNNITELRDMIAKHAAGLRFMGDPFPEKWQKARAAVAALNPDKRKQVPHITYERFQVICQECGISDEEQMFTLATVFMHNLGRTIYYGERHRASGSDALLANIMVLDSEWLSRAFVQVLEDKETNDNNGMLDHAWLDRIWRTHGRDDWLRFTWQEHPFLIRLMHAFDMSYVVRGSGGKRSLVPQLLPAAEPELPWRSPPDCNGVKPVRLICRMEDEAHGLMPRFIVQTAPYHRDCKAFWRDGVFLREPTYGTEALVTLEGTEKPVMTMAVSGAQPSWFLGELHRTLIELLAFWPGLDKTFHIGCPTRHPDGIFCKGEFDFGFVIAEDKEAPDGVLPCPACRKRYFPRELLIGYRSIEEPQKVQAVQAWSLAKQQAPCPRAFTLVPADRSWYDPRQFVPDKVSGKRLRLTLLSEHSLKPVKSQDFGVSPGWLQWLGPLSRIGAMALSGMALPIAGPEAREFEFAAKFMKDLGGAGDAGGVLGRHLKSADGEAPAWPSGADLEDLHELLKKIGLAPRFGEMQFVKIRHKGYLWVSKEEAEAFAEETPNLTYIPGGGSA